MNQKETLELCARCETARSDALAAGKDIKEAHEAAKSIWNGWAKALLDRREDLEQAGEWNTKSSVIFSTPQNSHHFDGDANFSGFVFPGEARFNSVTFQGHAWFIRATFKGQAWFDSAAFKGHAGFNSATFEGNAWFRQRNL